MVKSNGFHHVLFVCTLLYYSNSDFAKKDEQATEALDS